MTQGVTDVTPYRMYALRSGASVWAVSVIFSYDAFLFLARRHVLSLVARRLSL